MGNMPVLRKEEKEKVKLGLGVLSRDQIDAEMDALLMHYKVNKSQADVATTRKILKRFGKVTDELAAMRDENR
jgi:hypothetical protein